MLGGRKGDSKGCEIQSLFGKSHTGLWLVTHSVGHQVLLVWQASSAL